MFVRMLQLSEEARASYDVSSLRLAVHAAAPCPPDVKQAMNFFDQWQEVPDTEAYDNGFKIQWEAFIRHVAEDAPFTWNMLEGAKGVQLVECAHRSWRERRWVDVPPLAA